MDRRIQDLERAVQSDPNNEVLIHRLARAYAGRGQGAHAYELLVEHGELQRRSPLLLELGAPIAALQKTLLERFKDPLYFAHNLDSEPYGDWLSREDFVKQDLPALSLRFYEGSSPSAALIQAGQDWPLLQGLCLESTILGDAGLSWLSPLRSLRELNLTGVENLSDDDLNPLSALTKLESLDLSNTNITGVGLAKTKASRSLKRLYLWGCPGITDSGLAALATLTRLETLFLGDCPEISDLGFAALRTLRKLRSLGLESAPNLTSTGLIFIAFFPLLEHLDCELPGLTDEIATRLSDLGWLHSLHIEGSKLSSAGLAALATSTSLRHFTLEKALISVENFAALAAMADLEQLNLKSDPDADRGACDLGLEHLRSLKSLSSLTIDGPANTAAGLAHIVRLKKLEFLSLSMRSITDQDFALLSSLSELRCLYLLEVHLTDARLALLASLTQLEVLSVVTSSASENVSKITDQGLAKLSALNSLENLHLESCENISLEGLAALSSLGKLTTLHLDDTNLDTEAVRRVLPQVQDLYLNLTDSDDLF